MKNLLEKYKKTVVDEDIQKKVEEIVSNASSLYNIENLKKAFSFIDLTTLNSTDTLDKGKLFADNVSSFKKQYASIPNVAAICVYPSLVETVRKNLKDKKVRIAAVAAGFPSSQTFLEVKTQECKMAVEKGADDIDIVISIGRFMSGDYQFVFDEIKAVKQAIGDAHLKVILESGVLTSLQDVRTASIIAMEAGADFIKTSTGKMEPAATLEAVYVMTEAINDFYKATGKKIGIKPAGGVSTAKEAIEYLAVVKNNLGEEWLNSHLFRIGASRLANNLLNEIIKLETGKEKGIKHF
ncbi:MAG: deoxyribose-phosphate aldolase [Bacteroidetes bacterium]|nr:MAG: deoxyribose-phosphate aldolase [Bacteroidota bacterium]